MCRAKILLYITCMLLIAWSAAAGSALKQVRVENAGKRVYLVTGEIASCWRMGLVVRIHRVTLILPDYRVGMGWKLLMVIGIPTSLFPIKINL